MFELHLGWAGTLTYCTWGVYRGFELRGWSGEKALWVHLFSFSETPKVHNLSASCQPIIQQIFVVTGRHFGLFFSLFI